MSGAVAQPGQMGIAFGRAGIWIALSVVLVVAGALLPQFRDPENLANIGRQIGVLGILAIGQTFVIAAGAIDLSVGMLAGLVVVLTCALSPEYALLPVMLAMMCLGAGVGVLNGVMFTRLRLNPLILTFGMMSVLHGVIFIITDRSIGRAPSFLRDLANGQMWGVPFAAMIVLALGIAGHVALTRSKFGYHLLATGGNTESARRAGIPTRRIFVLAFALSGISAALAGLLLAGRIGVGFPLAGQGLELDAIVAVVLGGTALSGGRGSVARAIAGVVLLAIISNLLNLMQVSGFAQTALKGMIVVIAILVNQPPKDRA
ncbi:ABC transporter permease [Roseovarius aestuarii]|nr:ABC transporter permease [Roseovarius aestuarii]